MVVILLVFALGTPIAALTLTYLLFFQDGAKHTGRWGVRRQQVHVGASPYRAGESTKEVPQGAPLSLRMVCWLAAMGGVATFALLAPAGLLMLLAVADGGHALVSLLVLLVSLSGFPAGICLVHVARRVARNEAVSASTFQYLYVHHAGVALTMTLVDAASGRLEVAVFSVIVCLVLVAGVIAIHSAAKVLRAGEEPAS